MTGKIIWITGLSGVGKTTLAENLNVHLTNMNLHPILLDGDSLRKIFKNDNDNPKSYERSTRIDLARKYSLLSKNLSLQGFIVIVSTISMFDEIYTWNRKNIKNYYEVYLKVPLDELSKRDPKKIYKGFKDGQTRNVAGLDLEIDEPKAADLIYDFGRDPFLWENPANLFNCFISDLKKSFLFQHNLKIGG